MFSDNATRKKKMPEHSQITSLISRLKREGESRGYYQPLGAQHHAVFTDKTPTLLVTFECFSDILADDDNGQPLGFDLVADNGWSHLGILSAGCTWFRDPAVYAYFDRLIDDGFFEDFDQIIFMGAGMNGYGAAAFSVAAPGCTVILMHPQATLDPRVAEWDHRYLSMRSTSFTDRYGYGPEMVDGASQVFILYDPEEDMDAMHAALFTRDHVKKLRCRHLGHHILDDLIHLDILQPLLETANSDGDVAAAFYQLFRARHSYSPYLRRLLMQLEDNDRTMLAGLLCRHVTNRMDAPRFSRRLTAIERKLADAGRILPQVRT